MMFMFLDTLRSRFKYGVLKLIGVTIFWSSAFPFLAYGQNQCFDLFKTQAPIESLQGEINKIISPIQVRKGLYGAKRDKAREKILYFLENTLSNAKTVDEIISTFLNLNATGIPHDVYQEAFLKLDILIGVRENFRSFSKEDRARLAELFEDLSFAHVEMWGPVMEAYNILESPSYVPILINEWIDTKPDLMSDLMWSGTYLNTTLRISLQNLPLAQRVKTLKLLKDSLRVMDVWIEQNHLSHQEQIRIKEPLRSWQMLQQILVRNELQKAIEKLEKTKKPLDLSDLERILTSLHRHTAPYGFKDVFSVARLLQTRFKKLLKKNESLFMFGSFPNLSAHKEKSDIDVFFQGHLDRIYFEIKGGSYRDRNFSHPESQSPEATELSRHLLQTESDLAHLMEVPHQPGELLSIFTLPRTYQHGMSVIETEWAEMAKYFAMPSPVMIKITPTSIILQIYDSFEAPANLPAKIYEYPLL